MAGNDDKYKSKFADGWAPETKLVHGGTLRSQFGETSEALFLTQGFVYDCAETAEARFKNEDPGYQYSRFGNPTVAMFEERIRLLEDAEAARATATGMAAVSACALTRTGMVSRPLSITQALNTLIDGPVWRMNSCRWLVMKSLEPSTAPPRQRPWPSMCLVAE